MVIYFESSTGEVPDFALLQDSIDLGIPDFAALHPGYESLCLAPWRRVFCSITSSLASPSSRPLPAASSDGVGFLSFLEVSGRGGPFFDCCSLGIPGFGVVMSHPPADPVKTGAQGAGSPLEKSKNSFRSSPIHRSHSNFAANGGTIPPEPDAEKIRHGVCAVFGRHRAQIVEPDHGHVFGPSAVIVIEAFGYA